MPPRNAHGHQVESRAVRKAAELIGGRKALAERLGASVDDIEKWIGGGGRVPREMLLRVVDLILDELQAPGESSGGPPEAPPGRSAAQFSANESD